MLNGYSLPCAGAEFTYGLWTVDLRLVQVKCNHQNRLLGRVPWVDNISYVTKYSLRACVAAVKSYQGAVLELGGGSLAQPS